MLIDWLVCDFPNGLFFPGKELGWGHHQHHHAPDLDRHPWPTGGHVMGISPSFPAVRRQPLRFVDSSQFNTIGSSIVDLLMSAMHACLSVCQCVSLTICLCGCPSCRFIAVKQRRFVNHLSMYHFVRCTPACLAVCLSVWLFVWLSLWFIHSFRPFL